MSKQLLFLFIFVFFTSTSFSSHAALQEVQTINQAIEAQIYSVKKTKHYTVVEIGFHNPTDHFVEFTPQEIYLNDSNSYSRAPMPMEDVQRIEYRKNSAGDVPAALGIGLGIASLGSAIFGKKTASKAFGVAALSMGGAYVLTKGLENRARNNKLITFENNSITSIKRLPPGMTLGGFLYFPGSKKPTSITIIAKSKSGKFERKVFALTNQKTKTNSHSKGITRERHKIR